jgi:hypothetical protein
MSGLSKIGGVTAVFGIAASFAVIYNEKKMEREFRKKV